MPKAQEWIFAARGRLGDTPDYCFGDPADKEEEDETRKLFEQQVPGTNSGRSPVWRPGLLYPNSIGLYDIHGGVLEWTLSFPEEKKDALPGESRPEGNEFFADDPPDSQRALRIACGKKINHYSEVPTNAGTFSLLGLRIVRTLEVNEN
jgi:formylglycine-generating enzyme required for sulfatase activity